MKKRIVFDTLKTEFYEKVDKNSPFNVYPRPTLVRESFFSLNGLWDYAVSNETVPDLFYEKILVPYPPESLLSGVGRQVEDGLSSVYRRSFDLPDGFIKDKVILHFGAVDTICKVILNDIQIGKHAGGYLPFSLDVTNLIKEKNNVITVITIGDLSRVYPYGKKKKNRGGMWYTPTSGIWQTVWLESVPENYVKRLKITTDTESATIKVSGACDGAVLRLLDSGEEFPIKKNEVTLTPKDKHLWSPEDPYLYRFEIQSGEDRIESYFALREIGIKSVGGIKRLTLNGKPYLFNGLLDQGYFPDGILTPATPEAFERDILVAKSLGFNTLRKHIKIEPDIFYHLCDRLGMVVFQDMVNNSSYSFILDTALPTLGIKRIPDKLRHRNKLTRKIFLNHMKDTIEHLHSFPSVLYYTIFNEGWGQFSADAVYEEAKKLDPTRIFDATSGWFTQKKSDVDSRHVYFKPVKVKGPSERPIVISEFGGYSYRAEGHLFGAANYGYKIFNTEDELMESFERLYLQEILPGIKNGISALIYTQVSDVEDETNGIMTYDRKVVKLDVSRTAQINERLKEEFEKVSNEV